MKKNIIAIVLTLIMMITAVPLTSAAEAPATEANNLTTITYLDDGSYIVKTITSIPSQTRATTFTKSGNIVASHYSGDDELLWQYTLYADFEVVSGVSAVCTNARYVQNIYASGWSFSDGQATASGDTAYGAGIFKKKVLFITTSTVEIDLNIVCDVYGNLS